MLREFTKEDMRDMYLTCKMLQEFGYNGEVWKDIGRESIKVQVNPWGTVGLLHVKHKGYEADENDTKVHEGLPVLKVQWEVHGCEGNEYYSAGVNENVFIRLLAG